MMERTDPAPDALEPETDPAMTKKLVLALSIAIAGVSTLALPQWAEAKRMGGGGGAGMQRSLPPRAAPDAVPARPAQAPTAAPAVAGAGAAAAAPRRSWMGPIAGLAAGLGIAALFSHLGLGGELANFVMIALLVAVAFVAVRFLMRRFGSGAAGARGLQPAAAGAFGNAPGASRGTAFEALRPAPAAAPESLASAPAGALASAAPGAVAAASIPADFDTAGFERIAKMIFIRMQAANDSGDLDDLRSFTTPELFAHVRNDLHERGDVVNRTDVVQVDAQVLDVATDAGKQVVSVRFHGLIREVVDGTADGFDEVWHLVKPLDGSREWAIAGIQQSV